jgi:hypothetical protein
VDRLGKFVAANLLEIDESLIHGGDLKQIAAMFSYFFAINIQNATFHFSFPRLDGRWVVASKRFRGLPLKRQALGEERWAGRRDGTGELGVVR